MTKELKCGSLVPGCDWHATAETEAELLQRAAAHAKQAHDMKLTPQLAEKVRAAIHEA